MNKIMNKIQIVVLALIASVCVIAPGADAQIVPAEALEFSGNAAYVRGMSDVKPSVFGVGFTNNAISSWGIPVGQLVGHYADGNIITNALDLLPYVGQSLEVTDAGGNTVLSLQETGIHLYDDVLDDFVPITVTNGTLYINGSPISEGTDDQTLSLSDTTLSIDGGNSVDLSSIDTNTQLTETEVDNFVANNGYLTSETDDQNLGLSGTTLTIEDGTGVDLGATFATDQEVTEQISNAGGGDFFADGSVAMTGDLDMGGNNITNVHCLFLTDPSTGDEIKLEFVGGELIAGGTPVVMATAKMQQTTALAFANLDISMDGSTNITSLLSGGDGTGAFEYSVISNAMLSGETLSWMTADAPFEIQARRLGDVDYYTSPWYSMLYDLTVPLMPPLGTTATILTSPNPTDNGYFGRDIEGHQDSFVVGAEGEDRAYVYERTGGSWALAQTLTPPSGVEVNRFGSKVEITGDWLFVGDENAEMVHIYQPSGGSWSYFQTLDGKADFGAINGDDFGYKIDCSGDTVAISEERRTVGSNSNAGAVHIFVFNGTTWTKQHQFNNPNTQGDYMGYDIALDGDLLVVGAYQNPVSGRQDAGQAYVLRRTGTTWALEQTLQEASPVAVQYFGGGVAVDEANERIIVNGFGSGGNPACTLYYYTRVGGTWQLDQEMTFGNSWTGAQEIYLQGDHIVAIDEVNEDYYVLERDTTSWSQVQRHQESDPDGYTDAFGVAGNTLIIGFYAADIGISNSGKIYIYE